MFDIGFSEIVLIAVVALVVLGPEKLPKTARTLGVLFGRLQRYVGEVKADISRELELEELRKLQNEMQSTAQELKQSVETAAKSVESGIRDVERDLNAAGQDAAPAVADTAAPVALPGSTDAPFALTSEATPAAAGAEAPRQPALPGFDKI